MHDVTPRGTSPSGAPASPAERARVDAERAALEKTWYVPTGLIGWFSVVEVEKSAVVSTNDVFWADTVQVVVWSRCAAVRSHACVTFTSPCLVM